MKNSISQKVLGTMLLSIISALTLSSCATTPVVPLLQNRTLEISSERPEAFYDYTVCVKKFVFCTKKELKRDTYDFNDKEVRQKLKDTGFKLQVVQ